MLYGSCLMLRQGNGSREERALHHRSAAGPGAAAGYPLPSPGLCPTAAPPPLLSVTPHQDITLPPDGQNARVSGRRWHKGLVGKLAFPGFLGRAVPRAHPHAQPHPEPSGISQGLHRPVLQSGPGWLFPKQFYSHLPRGYSNCFKPGSFSLSRS